MAPSAASAPALPKPSLGSLFEHYGVELEDRAEQSAAVVEGRRCSGCGWLVREDEHSCRACSRELEDEDDDDDDDDEPADAD